MLLFQGPQSFKERERKGGREGERKKERKGGRERERERKKETLDMNL